MNLLFLGVSSFTGYHFVNEISKIKSIKIYCTLTKNLKDYDSIRLSRINLIKKKTNIKLILKTKFGDKKFIKLISDIKFNTVCLHHALTKNYNDDIKFDLKKSLNVNLPNIDKVFKKINEKSLLVISNTVFQKIKKKNYAPLNKYGISKTLTYEKIKKYCNKYNLRYKSVYITNPWGLFEEKKLNYFLIEGWLKNKKISISYPRYIRDNIFIEKLSQVYSKIIKSKSKKIDYFPSGYCCSNKEFIEAFKKKFEKFFNIKVEVDYLFKTKHTQPIKRVNGLKIKKKIIIKENLNKYFEYYKKIFIKKQVK